MVKAAFQKTVLLLCVLAYSQGAVGAGMRVSPLMLEFDADSNSALVKVSNDGLQKISVQIEALSWSQDQSGQDQYEPTHDIVFFPRIFSVEPGDQQVIRVGYQGESATEKQSSYRLYVQELPVQEPGQVEMKFAVRMGIPVFTSPRKPEKAWNIGEVAITEQGFGVVVENTGNQFVRIGDISITGRGDGGAELFTINESGWYVLAGRSRDFVLPITGMSCEQLASVELTVTSGNQTRNKNVDVSSQNCDSTS